MRAVFRPAAAGLVIDTERRGGKLAGFATSTGRSLTGQSQHKVYLFDALAGTGPSAEFELTSLQLTASGLMTSTGTADPSFAPTDPGAQALAVLGDTLWVGCANLMSSADPSASFLDNFPGLVLGFALDPLDHTRFEPGVPQPAHVVFTRGFNVTGLRAARTPDGRPVLYVTTSGAGRVLFGASPPEADHAFLEVIDPNKAQLVAFFPFGPAAARHAAAVRPDGLEAVVGRGDFGFGLAEIFRVSLLELDLVLDGTIQAPADLTGAILNGVANPITIPFANPDKPPTGRFTSALAYSNDGGRRLLAVSFNDSTLNVFDARRGRTPVFRRQHRLSRGNETADTFGPNASVLALRPGLPGRDFQGPDAFVGTIGVLVDPQTFTTRAVLDAARTY
ncbi:MAG: hypothetical protein KatS3mg102_1740 [Planctomycetota bacterium]|nr:MAG: hypothetical protein KatS3mg102_1740 [Planctomycetota bacterium]